MMQWGLTTLIEHRHSIENCFRTAESLGYRFIELNCVRDYYAHYNALQLAESSAELAHLKGLMTRYDLRCSAVDCHGLFGRSAEEFDFTCDYLQAGFKVAKALNSAIVVTSIPKGPAPYPVMVSRMRELCGRAALLRLSVAIEAEYGFTVGSPDELEKFLADVHAPNLKVNFDPFHFAKHGDSIPETVRRFFPDIIHVHLKEYSPERPVNPTRYSGVPGSPCSQMLDELARLGYSGVASAETQVELEPETDNPAAAIMTGIRRWEKRREAVPA